MSDTTQAPDISALDIPVDGWTAPFWEAAAREELRLPRCGSCGTHRWPPGPFCPACRSQTVEWVPAGPGRLYSFTIVQQRGREPDAPARTVAPGLIEFAEAGDIRIMAAIVDSPTDAIAIGAPLRLGWARKGDTNVPVFSIAGEGGDA